MCTPKTRFDDDVMISVERMMRFCYLATMQFEYSPHETMTLPLHLTRFDTLLVESSSFLYSLFDDRTDSIDLLRIWQGFNPPFSKELQDYSTRLCPFMEELKLVRNRLGFHGSLTRSQEGAGLGIFDLESGRAQNFFRVQRDGQELFLRMILWSIQGMDESEQPAVKWREFTDELRNYSVARSSA